MNIRHHRKSGDIAYLADLNKLTNPLCSVNRSVYIYTGWWLLEHLDYFPYIGNVIIPTDFHIFQRGRAQAPYRYIYISSFVVYRLATAWAHAYHTNHATSKRSTAGNQPSGRENDIGLRSKLVQFPFPVEFFLAPTSTARF